LELWRDFLRHARATLDGTVLLPDRTLPDAIVDETPMGQIDGKVTATRRRYESNSSLI
jgi:hypothetical protein